MSGLERAKPLIISLGTVEGDTRLETLTLTDDKPDFAFHGLAREAHFVKLEGTEYHVGTSSIVHPPTCADYLPAAVTPLASLNVSLNVSAGLRGAAADGVFRYEWRMDASRAGAAETSHVVAPPNITFLNESIALGDDQATSRLHHEFNVILADDERTWSSEYAFRLLETLNAVPRMQTRSFYAAQTLPASKWVLTDDYLHNDISMSTNGSHFIVRLSSAAFVHASPQIVRLDGVRGRFFSRRLHHALVRFVTRDGADVAAAQHIMTTRYGCTTNIPTALYAQLTAPTTNEVAADFQPFETHTEEPLLLLTMMEELPQGLHITPGLSYLLRRLDGQIHPLYPTAAAVAWPTAHTQSYIEYMESAFGQNLRHTRRLILHEKAHFMWSNLFSSELRSNWTTLAGWYVDPNATSGWSTTQQTEFVSAYAHQLNPNEDMAESISYYVENPARLQACCPEKFAFIRDRIMHGYRYVSRVRRDLTFQVLNLMPDYTYPGKIVRVSISVEGAPTADKRCHVEIELHTLGGIFDGAQWARFRLFSEIGTWMDVYLNPTNPPHNSILSGTFTISRYAKAGLWRPQQIVLRDAVGNQRFAGTNDYGWRLHVDNPLEDLGPPSYVSDSLHLNVTSGVLEGHPVHWVEVSWLLVEDQAMLQHGGIYVRLVNDAPGTGTRGLQEYGYPGLTTLPSTTACGADVPSTHNCERASITLLITPYRAAANYSASRINMLDEARNQQSESFSASPNTHAPVWVRVITADPDVQSPTLDLNNITVAASPTNPSAPNGETVVNIDYWARDDKSGLGIVSYRLLDPQGTSHFEYHYHANFHSTFFSGNATAWAPYRINVVLPAGSPPGTWGLESLELSDKVDNVAAHSFVENVHFETIGTRRRLKGGGESAADVMARMREGLRFDVR